MPKILLDCLSVRAGGGGYTAEFAAIFPGGKNPPGFDKPVIIVTPMPAIPGRTYELMLCGIFSSNHDGESRKCVDSLLSFETPLTLQALDIGEELEYERARQQIAGRQTT